MRGNVAALHDAEGDDRVEVVEVRIDEAPVDLVGLGGGDEAAGIEPGGRLRLLELEVDDRRSERLDLRDRLAHPGFDLRIAVVPEHRLRHAEGEAGDAALDRARDLVRGLAAGRGVGGVRALNRLVDDGGVSRIAGQRTHAVEAPAQRIHACAAHPADRRLQARDPAHARGDPHRSAGVGPEPHRRHARPHRDARARARPARQKGLAAPGVVRGALVGVDAGAAVRELHRDCLAEQHHAGPVQPLDDGAVGSRDVVGEQPGARRRRHARHVEQVLGDVRDAVQRTEVDARREQPVRGLRLGERAVPAHERERPEVRLERIDPFEEVLRDLRRGQLAGADRPPELDDGSIVDGGVHFAFSGRLRSTRISGRHGSLHTADR